MYPSLFAPQTENTQNVNSTVSTTIPHDIDSLTLKRPLFSPEMGRFLHKSYVYDVVLAQQLRAVREANLLSSDAIQRIVVKTMAPVVEAFAILYDHLQLKAINAAPDPIRSQYPILTAAFEPATPRIIDRSKRKAIIALYLDLAPQHRHRKLRIWRKRIERNNPTIKVFEHVEIEPEPITESATDRALRSEYDAIMATLRETRISPNADFEAEHKPPSRKARVRDQFLAQDYNELYAMSRGNANRAVENLLHLTDKRRVSEAQKRQLKVIEDGGFYKKFKAAQVHFRPPPRGPTPEPCRLDDPFFARRRLPKWMTSVGPEAGSPEHSLELHYEPGLCEIDHQTFTARLQQQLEEAYSYYTAEQIVTAWLANATKSQSVAIRMLDAGVDKDVVDDVTSNGALINALLCHLDGWVPYDWKQFSEWFITWRNAVIHRCSMQYAKAQEYIQERHRKRAGRLWAQPWVQEEKKACKTSEDLEILRRYVNTIAEFKAYDVTTSTLKTWTDYGAKDDPKRKRKTKHTTPACNPVFAFDAEATADMIDASYEGRISDFFGGIANNIIDHIQTSIVDRVKAAAANVAANTTNAWFTQNVDWPSRLTTLITLIIAMFLGNPAAIALCGVTTLVAWRQLFQKSPPAPTRNDQPPAPPPPPAAAHTNTKRGWFSRSTPSDEVITGDVTGATYDPRDAAAASVVIETPTATAAAAADPVEEDADDDFDWCDTTSFRTFDQAPDLSRYGDDDDDDPQPIHRSSVVINNASLSDILDAAADIADLTSDTTYHIAAEDYFVEDGDAMLGDGQDGTHFTPVLEHYHQRIGSTTYHDYLDSLERYENDSKSLPELVLSVFTFLGFSTHDLKRCAVEVSLTAGLMNLINNGPRTIVTILDIFARIISSVFHVFGYSSPFDSTDTKIRIELEKMGKFLRSIDMSIDNDEATCRTAIAYGDRLQELALNRSRHAPELMARIHEIRTEYQGQLANIRAYYYSTKHRQPICVTFAGKGGTGKSSGMDRIVSIIQRLAKKHNNNDWSNYRTAAESDFQQNVDSFTRILKIDEIWQMPKSTLLWWQLASGICLEVPKAFGDKGLHMFDLTAVFATTNFPKVTPDIQKLYHCDAGAAARRSQLITYQRRLNDPNVTPAKFPNPGEWIVEGGTLLSELRRFAAKQTSDSLRMSNGDMYRDMAETDVSRLYKERPIVVSDNMLAAFIYYYQPRHVEDSRKARKVPDVEINTDEVVATFESEVTDPVYSWMTKGRRITLCDRKNKIYAPAIPEPAFTRRPFRERARFESDVNASFCVYSDCTEPTRPVFTMFAGGKRITCLDRKNKAYSSAVFETYATRKPVPTGVFQGGAMSTVANVASIAQTPVMIAGFYLARDAEFPDIMSQIITASTERARFDPTTWPMRFFIKGTYKTITRVFNKECYKRYYEFDTIAKQVLSGTLNPLTSLEAFRACHVAVILAASGLSLDFPWHILPNFWMVLRASVDKTLLPLERAALSAFDRTDHCFIDNVLMCNAIMPTTSRYKNLISTVIPMILMCTNKWIHDDEAVLRDLWRHRRENCFDVVAMEQSAYVPALIRFNLAARRILAHVPRMAYFAEVDAEQLPDDNGVFEGYGYTLHRPELYSHYSSMALKCSPRVLKPATSAEDSAQLRMAFDQQWDALNGAPTNPFVKEVIRDMWADSDHRVVQYIITTGQYRFPIDPKYLGENGSTKARNTGHGCVYWIRQDDAERIAYCAPVTTAQLAAFDVAYDARQIPRVTPVPAAPRFSWSSVEAWFQTMNFRSPRDHPLFWAFIIVGILSVIALTASILSYLSKSSGYEKSDDEKNDHERPRVVRRDNRAKPIHTYQSTRERTRPEWSGNPLADQVKSLAKRGAASVTLHIGAKEITVPAVVVASRSFLVNAHWTAENPIKRVRVSTDTTINARCDNNWYDIVNQVYCPDEDAHLFTVERNLPMHSVPPFAKEGPVPGEKIMFVKRTRSTVYTQAGTFLSAVRQFNMPDVRTEREVIGIGPAFFAEYDSAPGDCGSLIVHRARNGAAVICGFHFAAVSGSNKKVSVFLTEEVVAGLRNDLFAAGEPDTVISEPVGNPEASYENAPLLQCLSFVDEHTPDVPDAYGRLAKVTYKGKQIQPAHYPRLDVPDHRNHELHARLTRELDLNGITIDPRQLKYWPTPFTEETFLEAIRDHKEHHIEIRADVCEYIKDLARSISLQPITFHYDDLAKLNRTASAGIGPVTLVGHAISVTEDKIHTTDWFENCMRHNCSELAKGRSPHELYSFCAKVEPRKLGADGRPRAPRIFYSGTLGFWNWLWKALSAAFAYNEVQILNGGAFNSFHGGDPHSMARMFCRALEVVPGTFDTSSFEQGDASQWDKSFSPEMMHYVGLFINAVLDRNDYVLQVDDGLELAGYSRDEIENMSDRQKRQIFRTMVNASIDALPKSFAVYKEFVFSLTVQMSGGRGTTLVNTLANMIVHYSSVRILNPTLSHEVICSHYRAIFYGDDFVSAHDDTVSTDGLAKCIHDVFNFKYTNPNDKTIIGFETTKGQCNFLGRNFDGSRNAPLPIETIINAFTYMDNIADFHQLLFELSHHKRRIYDIFVGALAPEFERYGIKAPSHQEAVLARLVKGAEVRSAKWESLLAASGRSSLAASGSSLLSGSINARDENPELTATSPEGVQTSPQDLPSAMQVFSDKRLPTVFNQLKATFQSNQQNAPQTPPENKENKPRTQPATTEDDAFTSDAKTVVATTVATDVIPTPSTLEFRPRERPVMGGGIDVTEAYATVERPPLNPPAGSYQLINVTTPDYSASYSAAIECVKVVSVVCTGGIVRVTNMPPGVSPVITTTTSLPRQIITFGESISFKVRYLGTAAVIPPSEVLGQVLVELLSAPTGDGAFAPSARITVSLEKLVCIGRLYPPYVATYQSSGFVERGSGLRTVRRQDRQAAFHCGGDKHYELGYFEADAVTHVAGAMATRAATTFASNFATRASDAAANTIFGHNSVVGSAVKTTDIALVDFTPEDGPPPKYPSVEEFGAQKWEYPGTATSPESFTIGLPSGNNWVGTAPMTSDLSGAQFVYHSAQAFSFKAHVFEYTFVLPPTATLTFHAWARRPGGAISTATQTATSTGPVIRIRVRAPWNYKLPRMSLVPDPKDYELVIYELFGNVHFSWETTCSELDIAIHRCSYIEGLHAWGLARNPGFAPYVYHTAGNYEADWIELEIPYSTPWLDEPSDSTEKLFLGYVADTDFPTIIDINLGVGDHLLINPENERFGTYRYDVFDAAWASTGITGVFDTLPHNPPWTTAHTVLEISDKAGSPNAWDVSYYNNDNPLTAVSATPMSASTTRVYNDRLTLPMRQRPLESRPWETTNVASNYSYIVTPVRSAAVVQLRSIGFAPGTDIWLNHGPYHYSLTTIPADGFERVGPKRIESATIAAGREKKRTPGRKVKAAAERK